MPAKKSNFTATEIKAGFLVLASVFVMVAFVASIRGCGSRGEARNRFSADFSSIIGLDLGADVRFGGVEVGRVVGIETDPSDRSRIRVIFEVPVSIPVNHGSVASIESISLTTAKHLEISTGGKDEPLHVTGDRIASFTNSGGFVEMPDLEGVITRLETVLDGLVALLGVERAQAVAAETGEEMVDLTTIAASLDRVLESGASTIDSVHSVISENRDGLGLIIDRLAALEAAASELLTNLNAAVEENREPLNATMVNFEKLSAEASRQVQELTESLAVTLQYLQEVSGNASDLVESQRPTLEQILLNLEETTRNLRKFSQTLADQPNALVRGSKPKGRSGGGK